MTWSSRKQLTYLGVILAIILVVLTLFALKLFIRPATCFDGRMNNDEQGIDCGGSCALVCQGRSQQIIQQWSQAFPVIGDVYNAAVYFENRNPSASVARIPYEFKIYDNENVLVVDPVQGETFIEPNRTSAIVAPTIQVGERTPAYVFFQFLEDPVWYELPQGYGQLYINEYDVVWSDLDSQPKLTARLENPFEFDLVDIQVPVIVYDASGNAVNTSQTVVGRIPARDSVQIFYTWNQPFGVDIAKTEIIPRINPFTQQTN